MEGADILPILEENLTLTRSYSRMENEWTPADKDRFLNAVG